MASAEMQHVELYSYDSLASPSCIRVYELLRGEKGSIIEGFLHQVRAPEDDDVPLRYIALSYTWGSERDLLPILIDGRKFMVRSNLLAALQALQCEESSRMLWIDAICINQDDVYEKSHQVGKMGWIYRSADAVIVWLGSEEADTSRIFEHTRSSVKGELLYSGKAAPTTLLDVVTRLLARDYWSRVWIIQEVMLASVIEIRCGKVTFQWDELVEACRSLRQLLPSGPAISLIDQRSAVKKRERSLLAQNLELLIKTYYRAECKEKRDRVFALLSLASDCTSEESIKPNYSIPRLTLLVEVLDFCRPKRPIEFISVLFHAFTNEERDESWKSAAARWTAESEAAPVVGPPTVQKSPIPGQKEHVRVTCYVVASSPLRDWVRCHSFTAVLDPQFTNSDLGGNDFRSAKSILRNRERVEASIEYDDRVNRADSSYTIVLLHASHFVVFSTHSTMTTTSPCVLLDLHTRAQRCSFSQCSMLSATDLVED